MKRLHKYLIKSFSGPLILTFLITLFVMIMQFLWKYIDDLVGKGLELKVVGQLLFYFGVSFIPMALPLAILLASLMTFGNFGENFELTAIKAAGVSLQRFLKPLIVLVTIISIVAFYFSNNILPVTNLKSRSLLYDIQRQRPEFNITAGQFYNGIEGYTIRILEKDYETNLLKKILIYDQSEKMGNISVTYADSGYMKVTPDEQNIYLILYNGYSYNDVYDRSKKRRNRKDKSYPFRKDHFKKESIVLKLTGFGLNRTDENLFKNNFSMLNMNQLVTATDSMNRLLDRRKTLFINTLEKNQLFSNVPSLKRIHKKMESDTTRKPENKQTESATDTLPFNPREILASLSQSEQETVVEKALMMARSSKNFVTTTKNSIISRRKLIRRHQVEFHRKFTLSFACLIFFFIGAPLGAIIRKGGLGLPITISVIFFVFYYIVSLSGEKFVRQEVMGPFAGMWLSSFILLPMGVFLTYKATNDSAIMNTETYLKWPKKLLAVLKKRIKSGSKTKNEHSPVV